MLHDRCNVRLICSGMGWEMMIGRDERLRVIQPGGWPVIHEMNHQEPKCLEIATASRAKVRETTGLAK